MVKIFPSILAANFANLEKDLKNVENNVDGFHMDIMDGRFVPNISFGFPVLESLRKITNKYFDTHLMIVEPDNYIERFSKVSDSITVHYEATTHLHRTISQIKKFDCEAGVSLNPHTPVSLLEEILPYLDKVLIMSVNPGFGGQKFIETTYNKIRKLKDMNSNVEIMIDGGVNPNNIDKLVKAGASSFVVGSAVFKTSDPNKAIKEMRDIL
ncbi:ribulose-phosphate 3-epimerase [Tepiditoga spiralis]|uniref:Ribulose-phosphate 3-epimerase n=1 Tax=Tepiditoga spiralis TaxID=2108365 RepID=A0A7G1GAC1_9BACT|nr:ribulose-phosphate 3-epimerase [Tepiditoga spiralis]BBE31092.1 ribulose-phosphate 3-epimerase [Tepiditoga spiralis]